MIFYDKLSNTFVGHHTSPMSMVTSKAQRLVIIFGRNMLNQQFTRLLDIHVSYFLWGQNEPWSTVCLEVSINEIKRFAGAINFSLVKPDFELEAF